MANEAASVTTVATTPIPAAIKSSALRGKQGVCRVEISRVSFDVLQPWQRNPQTKGTGTAFVLQESQDTPSKNENCSNRCRLLTNAHVVKSATDVRVRPHGSTRRFPAKVVVYAPDVDLALLEILGPGQAEDFVEIIGGGRLPFAEKLPELQESVHVVGFPTGGNTICITEGVVSRIDYNNRLVIQIDAAINPGNRLIPCKSGGPAFNAAGQVTGVAFGCKSQTKDRSLNNIGYLIPVSTVREFLRRCSSRNTENSDGNSHIYIYELRPSIPYRCRTLENRSLRLSQNVPNHVHGVLLTSLCETMKGILRIGDVLTKIDKKAVADDGQVILRGDDGVELIQHGYLLRGKRHQEPVLFEVYRDGEHVQCLPVLLRDVPSICPRWAWVDYHPDYLLIGALVFLPLSSTLRHQKKSSTRLAAEYLRWSEKWPSEWQGKTGLVVLTDILSHELSFGYTLTQWRLVETYNGIPVQSLSHLNDLWQTSINEDKLLSQHNTESSCSTITKKQNNHNNQNSSHQEEKHVKTTKFAKLGLQDSDDIVLEVKFAVTAQSEIQETHQIKNAHHITPKNPKYKY